MERRPSKPEASRHPGRAATAGALLTHVQVSSRIPAPARGVFALREDAFNLLRLAPLVPTHVEAPSRPVQLGDMHALSFRLPWKTVRMELLIESIEPGLRIIDVQRAGPFKYWRHEHRVEPVGEMHSRLVDVAEFRFFRGPLARVLDPLIVRTVLWLKFRRQHRQLVRLVHGHKLSWRSWFRAR